MDVSENSVRRMLNPKQKSRPEQYTKALLALGRAIEVSLVSIPLDEVYKNSAVAAEKRLLKLMKVKTGRIVNDQW